MGRSPEAPGSLRFGVDADGHVAAEVWGFRCLVVEGTFVGIIIGDGGEKSLNDTSHGTQTSFKVSRAASSIPYS